MSQENTEKWLWMPDEKETWIPVKLTSVSEDGMTTNLVDSDDNVHYEKSTKDVLFWKAADASVIKNEYENLVALEEFSEGAILHQLRKRYLAEKVYTSIGSILISVNPFKLLPIYNQAMLAKYKDRSLVQNREPHVFQTASTVYWDFISEKKNQSVIISGESGAGKTETTKQILQFFSYAAGSSDGIDQRILASNPILEAFGNAKTLRNNNSSRFGKWMEVRFNSSGQIIGSKIVNYLLEKTRVCLQTQDERNYHIFYQFLAGAPMEVRMKFNLKSTSDYKLTSSSGCDSIEGINDMDQFALTMKALEDLHFTSEEIDQIWLILTAILYLGNLEFIADGEGSQISNTDVLSFISLILGINPEDLRMSLITKTISFRTEVQHIRQFPHQAMDSRDSLCKALYGSLFDWLVFRINETLSKDDSELKIGVLDIFGFGTHFDYFIY